MTPSTQRGFWSFRIKLMVSMMLVVTAVTVTGRYLAQRDLAAAVKNGLHHEFQGELAALRGVRVLRQAALAELCRALVQKPRIHAMIEGDAGDDAGELLYPVAQDELRDVMAKGDQRYPRRALQGIFYRFLDAKGAVIPPSGPSSAGALSADEEAWLALPRLTREPQVGYLLRDPANGSDGVAEVVAMPIISMETDEPVAALAIGFRPMETEADVSSVTQVRTGLWLGERLHFPSIPEPAQAALAAIIAPGIGARGIGDPGRYSSPLSVDIDGAPHLLFYEQINPGSLLPPVYEVSLHLLDELILEQRHLRWKVMVAGTLILVAGLVASHFFSRRLALPVQKLTEESELNRIRRAGAEAELELSNEGLQRAVRFSSDASHQLKSPVTVLRAGLEELLIRDPLAPDEREELSELVHQTYRLTSIIDDLLLLARTDAGRLQLKLAPMDLSHLIEAGLDDLGTLPDADGIEVGTDFPSDLRIAGDRRYCTVIVQNLLENARKYNRPGGRIQVTARTIAGWVSLTVGNTGQSIPSAVQEHIFERFHRGSMGEDVPGHGLGLNLARELARLHGGELRLVRSDDGWTEFEARFYAADPTAGGPLPA